LADAGPTVGPAVALSGVRFAWPGADAVALEVDRFEVARAGASLVMVSHDLSLAPLFDRVVRLGEVARVARGGGASQC
jgi:hypothetical protein